MCGLTALIGTDITQAHVLAFQKLAQLSALRGQDSVGFYDFHMTPRHNEKSCKYYKELSSAGLYFGEGGRWDNSFYWSRYFTKKNAFNAPVVLVAHARAATKGAVEKKNAHPFHQGNILGVHNGTIHTSFEGRDKFDTDSEALFAYMNEHGEQKGLDMVNQLFSAAYALLWINLKERTFNVARNQDRTLYFTKHRRQDVCFLSSDSYFLKAVLPYIDKEFEEPQIVPKEEWISFDLNKNNLLRTQEAVRVKSRVSVYVPAKNEVGSSVVPFTNLRESIQANSNNAGSVGSTQNSGKNKQSTWKVEDVLADELTEEDVPHRIRIVEPQKNHGSACYEIRPELFVPFSNVSKLLAQGCECCGYKPFSYEASYFFKDGTTFLCKDCGEDIDCVRVVAENVKNKIEPVGSEPVVCH